MRSLVILFVALVALGCASSKNSTHFTSAAELKKMMAQPKPVKV